MIELGAVVLIVIGFAHSWLGERVVLQPLVKASLPRGPLPWQLMYPILRFGWHLGTLGWLALAAILLGLAPALVGGAFALLSALVVFSVNRRHLAWPLFLVSGLALLTGAGYVDSDSLLVAGWLKIGRAHV